MVDFKFWRRKRSDQEQSVTEVQAVTEIAKEVIENPAENPIAEQPQAQDEPSQSAVTEIEISATEELAEVELPKRTITGIRSLFPSEITLADLDSLEDILLRADFGVDASEDLVTELRARANKFGAQSDAEIRLLLKELLVEKLQRDDAALNLRSDKLPYVFLVVGVNGAGKTTTIGKLARWLSDGGWRVVLGASDTFRAAAVDQLATWAQRAEVEIVKPEREGQDPASVAYQTVSRAIETRADIAIIDTAGRLQNKKDLMDELGKISRAVQKLAQISEVLLVIDSTTGQNGVSQARAFSEVTEVSGIALTKLDGTAKGGVLYAIQREFDIPVKLVGVGEGINDFAFFSADEFAKGLVASVT